MPSYRPDGWTESRARAVLHSYRTIADLLHDPATVPGLQVPSGSDDALSYILRLAIEKADIEQAILYQPWPRLVPAALYWIGGYYQGEIALLEGCHRTTISRAVQQAEQEIVDWLVRGCYPDPPRYAERRPGWNLAPVVVGLFCSGGYAAQSLGRWLTDWSLERCQKHRRTRTWCPESL